MNSYILTYTGRWVDPFAMKPDDICIEDIAHALSCINRFSGHLKYPVNVAQHSICVSLLAGSNESAFQGLLHDASEAYINDVAKPLKETPEFKYYREIEAEIESVIYKKFGLPIKMLSEVARADRVMLVFEAKYGFGKFWNVELDPIAYAPMTVVEKERLGEWYPMTWIEAEYRFLKRFKELS